VIIIGLLGLAVTLVVVLIRNMPDGRGPRVFLGLSLTPLLLTTVLPMPFVLASSGPSDWARRMAVMISRIGIVLSVILFAIGVLLTLRAMKAGDRRGVKVLAIETALAGMPAGIVTASAAMFRSL
jgi:hypothetical protein